MYSLIISFNILGKIYTSDMLDRKLNIIDISNITIYFLKMFLFVFFLFIIVCIKFFENIMLYIDIVIINNIFIT